MPIELNYDYLSGHESMLQDEVRCAAFRDALAQLVTPQSVVLDIGAGTGILSLFAARAGARRVYAVERSEVAELARRLVETNGMSGRIEVLHADVSSIDLPEPVDVIVSEWLGGYALDENLFPLIVTARDRWLKPGGRLIPELITSWIAPAYDPRLQQEIDFWRSDPYGFNMADVAAIKAGQSRGAGHQVRAGDIRCTARPMWHIDARSCSVEDANRPTEARLTFISQSAGQVNALAAWFDARMSPGIRLTNAPDAPDTHWGRSIFPLGRVIEVDAGTRMDVRFVHEPIAQGRSRARWEIEVDGYRFASADDTFLA